MIIFAKNIFNDSKETQNIKMAKEEISVGDIPRK
jgi:hypothetical protein